MPVALGKVQYFVSEGDTGKAVLACSMSSVIKTSGTCHLICSCVSYASGMGMGGRWDGRYGGSTWSGSDPTSFWVMSVCACLFFG